MIYLGKDSQNPGIRWHCIWLSPEFFIYLLGILRYNFDTCLYHICIVDICLLLMAKSFEEVNTCNSILYFLTNHIK